jgi:hypothetical protein
MLQRFCRLRETAPTALCSPHLGEKYGADNMDVTRLFTGICVFSGAANRKEVDTGKRWMPADFRLTRVLLLNGDSVDPTVADKPA